jgi:hypothetical protein
VARGRKTEHPPDFLRDYEEWARHRYDPGHYLGGTLPPYLRHTDRKPRGSRLLGITFIVGAVLTLPVVIAYARDPTPGFALVGLLSAALAALQLVAGSKLLGRARRSARPKRSSD